MAYQVLRRRRYLNVAGQRGVDVFLVALGRHLFDDFDHNLPKHHRRRDDGFFFASRRRHTISLCDWSSDVCSSDLMIRRPPRSTLLPFKVCSMHHSYSSSVSPFQAKTGTPLAAIAAAAWSWVEKMLHELQRTVAPRCTNDSISTAVWIVMCRQPTMRAPDNGLAAPNSSRNAISPGISVSAIAISRRPQSASPISATL